MTFKTSAGFFYGNETYLKDSDNEKWNLNIAGLVIHSNSKGQVNRRYASIGSQSMVWKQSFSTGAAACLQQQQILCCHSSTRPTHVDDPAHVSLFGGFVTSVFQEFDALPCVVLNVTQVSPNRTVNLKELQAIG